MLLNLRCVFRRFVGGFLSLICALAFLNPLKYIVLRIGVIADRAQCRPLMLYTQLNASYARVEDWIMPQSNFLKEVVYAFLIKQHEPPNACLTEDFIQILGEREYILNFWRIIAVGIANNRLVQLDY